jgi:hypothetical protein
MCFSSWFSSATLLDKVDDKDEDRQDNQHNKQGKTGEAKNASHSLWIPILTVVECHVVHHVSKAIVRRHNIAILAICQP